MNDWESYWNNIRETGNTGQVFWDYVSESSSIEELARYKKYMDPSLPVLDLGCGNGRQSRFLAKHFKKVIGADISDSAIRLAKFESTGVDNVEFRVFDAINPNEAENLHAEFGDMNIYMRGVLHMIKRRFRPSFIENLELLLGHRGTLYQIEMPSEAILYLRTLPEEIFSQIPKITRRIGFNFEERQLYYPDERWIVLDQNQHVSISTIPLMDREVSAIPANYLILKRREANE